jgi:glycosyltransferase involved in cell wall biosynthesis
VVASDKLVIQGLYPQSRHEHNQPHVWADTYFRWPSQLWATQSRLFHIVDQGLGWYAPFLRRQPFVITVHDVLDLLSLKGRLSSGSPPLRRRPLIRASAQALSRAVCLIAHSHFTANALRTELGLDSKAIVVVAQVLHHRFLRPASVATGAMRSHWGCDKGQVVLYVGSAAPHKNRFTLFRAFALLQSWLPHVRLVLLSTDPTPAEAQFLVHSGMARYVHFVSQVSIDQLPAVYGAADVLIFPSLYEGVGRPPIEAMACGCPVISSVRGGLSETVQDAALPLSDPSNHIEIARAARAVLTNAHLASELRDRGLVRAAQYRRADAGGTLLDLYCHWLNS